MKSINLNQDHINQAWRQVGVIVAATGLITGLLDLAQLPTGAVIAGLHRWTSADCYTEQGRKEINKSIRTTAWRQVGVIVAATGLITGLLLAQLPTGAVIAGLGWYLIILGSEEKHDDT